MSENVPPPGQPGREAEVLEALREASRHDPRLVELPPEEVARRLVLEGRVEGEPSPELVAEMMLELEVEEQEFDPDVQPGGVVIHVREVFAGLFLVSTFMVTMSAVLLLQAPREGDRNAAWFWAAVFAASSFVADCCFWELL